MRDAVAEVLAERAHLGARRIRMSMLGSLILHLVLFGIVIAGARRIPPPDRIDVLNIRLAPMARPAALPPAPATPRAATPAPRVEPPPAPATTPPAKKEAYAPKQESIFGRSDRPVAPPETKTPETKPPVATPTRDSGSGGTENAFATPAVGTAGVTGIEGGDFPYTMYVNQMVNKIGGNWFRPQSPGEVLAEVYFVIDRDGTIRDVKVTRPSGNARFDRASERAVRDSSPLPPLPFAYRGTWVGVRLTFH